MRLFPREKLRTIEDIHLTCAVSEWFYMRSTELISKGCSRQRRDGNRKVTRSQDQARGDPVHGSPVDAYEFLHEKVGIG